MGKCQASKRARAFRKAALWAGLGRNFAHPSHVAGEARCARHLEKKLHHRELKSYFKSR